MTEEEIEFERKMILKEKKQYPALYKREDD